MQHKNKITILCIPYTHAISHISRPLMIAKELRNRGHEVIFAGEHSNIKFIQQEKFNIIPLHEPDSNKLFDNIRKGKLKFVGNKEIKRMIEADLSLYNKVKPDIVLTDGRFTAPISTHIAKLKHVAIVNASSTAYRMLPHVPFFEWTPNIIISRETWLWKTLELLNLKIEMFVLNNVMNIFKKMGRKYKLKEKITATNCLTGKDITLIADIPEYLSVKKLPENYHYIGSLTLKNIFSTPSWWPPKKNGNPLVYITMGTTGIGIFFHKVYKLIQESNLTAIITTGAQVNKIKTINGKIYVESFLDGNMVMGECDIVICHGGNGTIYQAIYHGKPVICIPTHIEQAYNARRAETLGIGKTLSWKKFHKNPTLLLDVIDIVLKNHSFTEKAQQMQSLLKNYDGEKISADIIENYILKNTY